MGWRGRGSRRRKRQESLKLVAEGNDDDNQLERISLYFPFFSEHFLKAEKMTVTVRVSQKMVISQSIVIIFSLHSGNFKN